MHMRVPMRQLPFPHLFLRGGRVNADQLLAEVLVVERQALSLRLFASCAAFVFEFLAAFSSPIHTPMRPENSRLMSQQTFGYLIYAYSSTLACSKVLQVILPLNTFKSTISAQFGTAPNRIMIEDDWRFFASSGNILPGGPSTWHILDWDQRRIVSVTMDEEQEEEDIAIECLKKHVDELAPDVYGIYVSNDGELISTFTDPEVDHTSCVYDPPLKDIQLPDGIQTVRRSELEELDRLGPNVDLVSPLYPIEADAKKVIFNYDTPHPPTLQTYSETGRLQILLYVPVYV